MSQLTVISIVAFLHFISWHLISPYIALVAKAQGAGTDTIGLIMAAYAILPMIFAVPTGVVCDRAGTRKVFIISSTGVAIASYALYVSRTIHFLAIALAALGLFHVLQSVASQVTIASMGDSNVVYRNFAIYGFYGCVGQLVGPPLGGVIAKNFGYNTLFMVSAFLALLMVPLAPLAREIKPSKPKLETSNSLDMTKQNIQALLRRPSYIIS